MKKLIIVVIIFGIICGILLHFQEAQSKENNIIMSYNRGTIPGSFRQKSKRIYEKRKN